MKYKGIELKPLKKVVAFEVPKEMIVWDSENGVPLIKHVIAIVPSTPINYPVITENSRYNYCAEIPKPQMGDMNRLEVIEHLYWKNKHECVVTSRTNNKWLPFGCNTLFCIEDVKFGILKHGKVTEFELPQVEVTVD